jgi:hypothetical protein
VPQCPGLHVDLRAERVQVVVRETACAVAGRPAQGVRRPGDALGALAQAGQPLGERGAVRFGLQAPELAVEFVPVRAEPLEEGEGLLERLVLGRARVARIDVRSFRRSWAISPPGPNCARDLARSVWSSTVRRACVRVRSTPRLAAPTAFTVA